MSGTEQRVDNPTLVKLINKPPPDTIDLVFIFILCLILAMLLYSSVQYSGMPLTGD